MLVQVALLVTGLFAVLTLSIDVGYLTLTRVQMQNAADTGALEGLRLRDFDPAGLGDGFASDCLRRLAARDLVRWVFDDNRNPDDGDPIRFGAGPQFGVVGGAGALDASATLTLDDTGVYKPDPQINQSQNRAEGDMVSGTFVPAASADEEQTYARADLSPGAPVPPGASGLAQCPASTPSAWTAAPSGQPFGTDDAFLVRLRRTADRDGLDRVDGVSSAGPPVPLLFGRGALIATDAESTTSVRRDGFVVRATAIARARPVWQAGAAGAGLDGVVGVALTLDAVAGLPASPAADTFSIVSNRLLSAGTDVGRFVDPLNPLTRAVGWPAPVAVAAPSCAAGPLEGLAPVYQVTGATPRIVAFVFIRLEWPDCGGDPLTVAVSRDARRMAAENASARPAPDALAALTVAEVSQVRADQAGLSDRVALAPVLAR